MSAQESRAVAGARERSGVLPLLPAQSKGGRPACSRAGVAYYADATADRCRSGIGGAAATAGAEPRPVLHEACREGAGGHFGARTEVCGRLADQEGLCIGRRRPGGPKLRQRGRNCEPRRDKAKVRHGRGGRNALYPSRSYGPHIFFPGPALLPGGMETLPDGAGVLKVDKGRRPRIRLS